MGLGFSLRFWAYGFRVQGLGFRACGFRKDGKLAALKGQGWEPE